MSLATGPADPPGTSRSTSATIQPNILRYLVVVAAEHGVDLRPLLKQVGWTRRSCAPPRCGCRTGRAAR